MPNSRQDDRALLERLNALKPTTVTLDGPANTASPLLPATAEQPVSVSGAREDALAARLRVLRNRPSSAAATESEGREGLPPSANAGVARVPGLSHGRDDGTAAPPLSVEPPNLDGRLPKGNEAGRAPAISPEAGLSPGRELYGVPGVDASEESLEALLESLADEEFDPTADESAEALASEQGTRSGSAAKLQKGGPGQSASTANDATHSEEEDNSDGEQIMTRAVETILVQISDEIKLKPPPCLPSASAPDDRDEAPQQHPGLSDDTAEDPALPVLPAVPSQLADQREDDAAADDDDGDDFERDISARLASLRGLGPNPADTDALGGLHQQLPSAPTFRPQDRARLAGGGSSRGLRGSSKYTDEDQRTWCVVCLEDAAVRCDGCDGDVYCARCWRDMHLGPSAGHDERGHRWVKFERNPRRP